MAEKHTKRAAQEPTSANDRGGQSPTGAHIDSVDGNARDREMGRDAPPLGDLGSGQRTWTPPEGEQGISNRPDDARTTNQESRTMAQDTKTQDTKKRDGQRRSQGEDNNQQRGGQGSGNQTSGKPGGNQQGGSGGSQNKGDSGSKGDGESSGRGGDRNA
jgi:hypothetical protein